MTQARIRSAFDEKVKAWAASQSVRVAWPGYPFTPPAEAYAKAFLIPGRTLSRDLSGLNRSYSGIYQVSLYLPLGNGPAQAEALAASLDAAFPVDDPLMAGELYVFLTAPMSPAAGLEMPDRTLIPVSCSYRAEDYLF